MAKNVNVWVDGFELTGSNVNFPQYTVNIRVEWVKNDGTMGEREGAVLFPNILAQCSNAWLKENLEDLTLAAVRHVEGIDD